MIASKDYVVLQRTLDTFIPTNSSVHFLFDLADPPLSALDFSGPV